MLGLGFWTRSKRKWGLTILIIRMMMMWSFKLIIVLVDLKYPGSVFFFKSLSLSDSIPPAVIIFFFIFSSNTKLNTIIVEVSLKKLIQIIISIIELYYFMIDSHLTLQTHHLFLKIFPFEWINWWLLENASVGSLMTAFKANRSLNLLWIFHINFEFESILL